MQPIRKESTLRADSVRNPLPPETGPSEATDSGSDSNATEQGSLGSSVLGSEVGDWASLMPLQRRSSQVRWCASQGVSVVTKRCSRGHVHS